MTIEIINASKVLWNYLNIMHDIQPSDLILVCGGHDIGVAKEAVRLFKDNYAPIIVVSGGITREIYGENKKALEAEILGHIIHTEGVPKSCILLEKKSKNTNENITFTEQLLNDNHITFSSIIMVQKPYAKRRAWCLARKLLPHKKIMMSSSNSSFDDYCYSDIPIDKIIGMMVGEIQRLIYAPIFGWIDYVDIPANVLDSYYYLCQAGFTERLMSEEVIEKCKKGTQDNTSINAK